MSRLFASLFRKKSLGSNEHNGTTNLNKTLSVWDLSLMGIAAIIGAGIFSTIGKAAFEGGPGIIFLIIFICITCLFCAMCYAEFASRVQNAGSAYSYIYATLGELPAWVIGWALILEYSFSNSVLAIAWSSYFSNVLSAFSITLPEWMQTNYFSATDALYAACPHFLGVPIILNLSAFSFNAFLTFIALIGIKEAKWTSHITVTIKLLTIFLVIVVGSFYVDTSHWSPLFPNQMKGVLAGTSAIFFAFFGFDSISTMAEESKNPQRDLPRSMIFSLLFCALVYIMITLVITGIANYKNLNVEDPIAYIFESLNMNQISFIVSVSALFVITSAFIVFQIAQPRVWLSMGRDGLLSPKFAQVHPKYKTPVFGTIITGLMVGVPALFLDMAAVTDLSSIGTLFTFILVCGGVFFLPKKEAKSGQFSIPYWNGKYFLPLIAVAVLFLFFDDIKTILWTNPSIQHFPQYVFMLLFVIILIVTHLKNLSLIPLCGVLCCLFLMTELGLGNWIAFFVWLSLGLLVYFFYGRKNSRLNTTQKEIL